MRSKSCREPPLQPLATLLVFGPLELRGGTAIEPRIQRGDLARERIGFVLATIAAVMIGALALAFTRRRRLAPVTPPTTPADNPADALAREIADLDAAFAAQAQPTVTERDAYEHRRAVLKRALTERLARRRGP